MANVIEFPQRRANEVEVLADKLVNLALVSTKGDPDLAACVAERAMQALLNMLPSDG
ncbi:MAG: hypothetical protein AB7E60_14675 [Sphingobium sp.]